MARLSSTSASAAHDSTEPRAGAHPTPLDSSANHIKRKITKPLNQRVPDMLTEEGYVPWRRVSTNWRRNLASHEAATVWRNSNMTPNTIFRSFLFQRPRGSLKLYEGLLNGEPTLFYSTRQLNRALAYMSSTPNISDEFVKQSFNPDWIVPKNGVKQLQVVYFETVEQLNAKLLAMKQAAIERKKAITDHIEDDIGPSLAVAEPTAAISNIVSQPVSSSTSSEDKTQSNVLKRALDESAAYPTPSPSIEGTPEPSTDSPVKKTKLVSAESLLARQAKLSLKARAQARELEATRSAWASAVRDGGATFLSIDFETWEFDHDLLLEVGWSLVEFNKEEDGSVSRRVEHQHTVVAENKKRRNKKFAPDARDHFDFGTTTELSLSAVRNLLHALFASISSSSRLFLVFHDPRADLKSLYKLGFKPNKLQFRLGHADLRETGTYVVDTQSMYSAWSHDVKQRSLNMCCTHLEVPTQRLHNAGNDAVYTRLLLEAMMDIDRQRPDPLVVDSDVSAE
ncbi:hypothetical protein OIV83_003373 [Microbotryomycetes sp. JL201]|nr:hypothetical protein OIV83_003373 [Microbotryomycetes sp. JL201]